MIILLLMMFSMVSNAYSSCGLPLKSVETIFNAPLKEAIRAKQFELRNKITEVRIGKPVENQTPLQKQQFTQEIRSLAQQEESLLCLHGKYLANKSDKNNNNTKDELTIFDLLEQLPAYQENMDQKKIDDIHAIFSLTPLKLKNSAIINFVSLDIAHCGLTSLEGLEKIYQLLKRKQYTLMAVDASHNNISEFSFTYVPISSPTSLNISDNPITIGALSHFKGNEQFTLITTGPYPLREKFIQQLYPIQENDPFLYSASMNLLASSCLMIATLNALLASPFLLIQKIPKLSPTVPRIMASPFLWGFKKFTSWGKKISSYEKPTCSNWVIYSTKHHQSKVMQNFYPFYLNYRLVSKKLSDTIYMPLMNAVIRT